MANADPRTGDLELIFQGRAQPSQPSLGGVRGSQSTTSRQKIRWHSRVTFMGLASWEALGRGCYVPPAMPIPTIIPSVAALKDFVGHTLGTSDWITISQERINTFADATGDHQWIHCDTERAERESPFKSTIAHGYLTVSLAPALLAELVIVNHCGTVINTGIEKMRLSTPVLCGARVRMSATLQAARDLPKGGVRVTIAVRFEVDGEQKPACHGNVTYVYYP